ncbi:MAG: vWA domain-containing protein [Planctomycetota bacterium]
MVRISALALAITFGSVAGFGPASCFAENNVVVVLDDSGSMDDRMRTKQGRVRRIDAAKKALTSVLMQLPPETNVGVLALNTDFNGSNWIIPFGTGTSQEWSDNVQRLRASGGTPLGEFMKVAADQLLQLRDQQIYGTYRLLIVTDGEASDPNLVDGYLPDILSRGLTVDVIGVDMQSDHSLATRVHSYRRADDDQALQSALAEVFAETSSSAQDADADFEILAALPDGFAEAALTALAKRGNTPIGEGVGSKGDSISFNASINPTNTAVDVTLGGLLCCMLGIVGLVGLTAVIFIVGTSRRR